MKLRKIKYSKIAVVVFLTVLIWVWADLALDTEHTIPRATMMIGRSRSSLWISFRGEPAVDINNIVLKGPVSKIGELKRIISNDPQKLEFTLNPEQQAMVDPGEYPQDVSDFIKNIDWIRELGLTVESCKPDVVDVNVVELVKRELTVQCLDEDGNYRKPESADPQKVDMFVPHDWLGEKLTAYIELTRADIVRARSVEIEKTPYIVLVTGQPKRYATTPVKIKMPPEEDLLGLHNVGTPTLGYCFSANLQGKYKVEKVANLEEVLSITIRATPAAKQAYEEPERFQVILEIIDKDIKKAEEGQEIRREVIYNFPKEFVSSKQIELVNPKVTAQFKLVKVSPAENP